MNPYLESLESREVPASVLVAGTNLIVSDQVGPLAVERTASGIKVTDDVTSSIVSSKVVSITVNDTLDADQITIKATRPLLADVTVNAGRASLGVPYQSDSVVLNGTFLDDLFLNNVGLHTSTFRFTGGNSLVVGNIYADGGDGIYTLSIQNVNFTLVGDLVMDVTGTQRSSLFVSPGTTNTTQHFVGDVYYRAEGGSQNAVSFSPKYAGDCYFDFGNGSAFAWFVDSLYTVYRSLTLIYNSGNAHVVQRGYVIHS